MYLDPGNLDSDSSEIQKNGENERKKERKETKKGGKQKTTRCNVLLKTSIETYV